MCILWYTVKFCIFARSEMLQMCVLLYLGTTKNISLNKRDTTCCTLVIKIFRSMFVKRLLTFFVIYKLKMNESIKR